MSTANEANLKPSQSLHLSTHKLDLRRVLVTTDFSESSERAVKAGASLAQYFGASLTVLHCVPPITYESGFDMSSLNTLNDILEAAKKMMQDDVATIPGVQGLQHHLVTKVGSVVQTVKDQIAQRHIDLIVCASHGATGFEKVIFGSTAEAILRHVNCPVLVVGPHCKATVFEMNSVLFCSNLTSGSNRPAQYAAALAQECNAQLTLVHAAPLHKYVLGRLMRHTLRKRLRELLPADIQNWCHLKVVIARGYAVDNILPIARRERANIIIAGISEEGVLVDHLPWGTLTSLIGQGECPVLAIRGHI